MRGAILETADLLIITGYKKSGDAARCLRNQGIKIFNGRNGPWTTLQLINAAGGAVPQAPSHSDPEAYDPGNIF